MLSPLFIKGQKENSAGFVINFASFFSNSVTTPFLLCVKHVHKCISFVFFSMAVLIFIDI